MGRIHPRTSLQTERGSLRGARGGSLVTVKERGDAEGLIQTHNLKAKIQDSV